MNDEALLAAVARGDRTAMRTLYDAFGSRALITAQRILRNDADAADTVQETFVELWKRAADFDAARGNVRAWIVTIARTRAISRLRKMRTANHAERASSDPSTGSSPEEAPSPAAMTEARRTRDRLSEALALLPQPQREVVEIAYFEGLSQRETAARLEAPLGTIKTRIRLAMEKLAQLLVDEAREESS